MKKIIGSRMAVKLATEKFGKLAYVKRSSKIFTIGTVRMVRIFGHCCFDIDRIFGQGKSWAEALTSAGIEIPVTPMLIADPKEAPWQIDTPPTDDQDPNENQL